MLNYNNLREVFPNTLIAGSFAPAQLLELPKPEMREAPKVSFG